MAEKIQIRRDTQANWSLFNPVLADGEIGYEKQLANTVYIKYKIGDGLTQWNSMPYFTGGIVPITNQVLIDIPAFTNIPAFTIVTSTGLLGDVNNYNTRNKIVGIATEAINNGFSGKIISVGTIQNSAWAFTKGDNIYVGINGQLTNIAPAITYIQIIGTAIANDTISVNIQQSILI